ncbi:hypothetical protein F4553_001469 [Allocatelliglobosispora scoriae]|uniref:Uncharacterized protein n=1 Tax=Allocatelliglobosispora scoriae TaxID=643052 RepID=A0A841BMN9_9ACTN|nr:DUF6042 family protein [Allocatelliglobosispora scoriae]MBB5868090.1 hypothetical protein [Allocatelliglobosispora scoriae]
MAREIEWQPDWRWSRMHPAWVRWLPCAIASLRVVPADADAFPRSWWDQPELETPWDEPIWCDPGSLDEWIESNTLDAAPELVDATAQLAESHYDQIIDARSRRIETFTALCRGAGIPVPLTLRQLLDCLIALGVFDSFTGEDGEQWVAGNLDINPLDVLGFSAAEAAEEATMQQVERGVIAGIGLRRAAEALGPDSPPDCVRVTLRELSDFADLPPLAVRRALGVVVETSDWISVDDETDLVTVGLDTPITIHAEYSRLATVYEMDELQAPEHMI